MPEKNVLTLLNARGRTRTGTGANPRDFKSLASTYSATRAKCNSTFKAAQK